MSFSLFKTQMRINMLIVKHNATTYPRNLFA